MEEVYILGTSVREHLYDLTLMAYKGDYANLLHRLSAQSFALEKEFYQAYRESEQKMKKIDPINIGYGQAVELAFSALDNHDMMAYLTALKVMIEKLGGNQRYRYYDRKMIRQTLEDQFSGDVLQLDIYNNHNYPPVMKDVQCDFLPIGFRGMSMKDYRMGMEKSIYDQISNLNQNALKSLLEEAVKNGDLYDHIVSMDHFINKDSNHLNKSYWDHLISLLIAFYDSEVDGWTQDYTIDLIQALKGLKNTVEAVGAKEAIYGHIKVLMQVAVVKMTRLKKDYGEHDAIEIANFLMNVYLLSNDDRLLDYIHYVMPIIERVADQEILQQTKIWIKEVLENFEDKQRYIPGVFIKSRQS